MSITHRPAPAPPHRPEWTVHEMGHGSLSGNPIYGIREGDTDVAVLRDNGSNAKHGERRAALIVLSVNSHDAAVELARAVQNVPKIAIIIPLSNEKEIKRLHNWIKEVLELADRFLELAGWCYRGR